MILLILVSSIVPCRFKMPCASFSSASAYNQASSMFHSRYAVLFFVCVIAASLNRADVTYQKPPVLSKRYSQRSFVACQMHFGKSSFSHFDLLLTVMSSSHPSLMVRSDTDVP